MFETNGVRRPSLAADVGWIVRYFPIPFVDRGRSFSGADCRGLSYLILEHEAGIYVPEPEDLYRGTDRRDLVDMADHMRVELGRWREVTAGPDGYPMFSVLLFTIAGLPTHVAVSLGGRAFIHTQKGYGVRTGDLDEADPGQVVWGARLKGAYVYGG